MNIRPFQPEDEAAVVRLWKACGLVVPQNDPHRDIALKRKVGAFYESIGFKVDEAISLGKRLDADSAS